MHLTTSGRLLCIALAWLFSAQLLMAQSGGSTFPITQELVVRSLGEAGTPVSPYSVQLPASLSANVPRPTLVIEKREPAGLHRERIRFACAEPHGCLPFYALVAGSPESDGTAVAAGPHALISQDTSSLAPAPKPAKAQFHPGDRATLLLANHFMRISLPVILIDTGRSGAEVRVASLDRKQTYRGLLSGDGTVHGDLP